MADILFFATPKKQNKLARLDRAPPHIPPRHHSRHTVRVRVTHHQTLSLSVSRDFGRLLTQKPFSGGFFFFPFSSLFLFFCHVYSRHGERDGGPAGAERDRCVLPLSARSVPSRSRLSRERRSRIARVARINTAPRWILSAGVGGTIITRAQVVGTCNMGTC